jgi:5-methylcytosine-specific restriction protein B
VRQNKTTLNTDESMINLTNDMKVNNDEEDFMKRPLNLILYGPPGTGKTYNTVNKALEILGIEVNGKPRAEIKQLFDDKMKEGQIVFTTFHQSMSYEDFIEGIKPLKPVKENDVIRYGIENGVFKKLCIKAAQNPEMPMRIKAKEKEYTILSVSNDLITIKADNIVQIPLTIYKELRKAISDNKITPSDVANPKAGVPKRIETKFDPYIFGYRSILYALCKVDLFPNIFLSPVILIIDEINRGNVAQIFGELITLIEEDKRLGNAEALEVTLPYSKEKFGVPPNLYIIGTMNTADRSIEALDTALRRRFCFEEMYPRYNLPELDKEIAGVYLKDLLKKINDRIEKLLDKDHMIGHSYFMSINNIKDLKAVFQNKVIPLLQEYFFGDFGKIGLVLGAGFFENDGKQDEGNKSIFASFDDYEDDELSNRHIYRLKNVVKMDDNEFTDAIETLMG